eukprot:CAMPEP_0206584544 /NCGR_PEP_ID=MMETSP0325_2-20121206/35792_1 /ASSEMBLY_ACC=CAM_ASM_000347 /TAXON_ID=2866 /ORGANISM="Crypthecodinium cohnii, Strain Seligo" /LENGTH=810 /DNA_ID=CAMNT_0054091735 /DNA_START=14 /DNA_END=2443 /DNA_ORIENTATION=+
MASAIGGWAWEAPTENRGAPSALFGDRSRPSEAGASLWELLQGPRRPSSAATAAPSTVAGGAGDEPDFLGSLVRQKNQRMMDHMPPPDPRDIDGRGSAPRRYGERLFGPPSSASPPRGGGGGGFDLPRQREQTTAAPREPFNPWDNIKRHQELQRFDAASSSGPARDQSPFDTHRGEENLEFEFERSGGASNVEGTLRRNFAKCDPRGEGLVEARDLFDTLRRDPEGQVLLGLTCLPGEEEPSWPHQKRAARLSWPDVLDLFLQRGLSALTASSAGGSQHRGEENSSKQAQPTASAGALAIPRALEDIVSRTRNRGVASLEASAVASLAAKAGTAAAGELAKGGSGHSQLVEASQPVAGRSAAPVAIVGGNSSLPSTAVRARTLSPILLAGTTHLASAGLAPSSRDLVSGLAAVSTERPITREEMLSSGRLLPSGDGTDGGRLSSSQVRSLTPGPVPTQGQPPLPPPHTVSLGGLGHAAFPGTAPMQQGYPMMPMSMPLMVPNHGAPGYYPQAMPPHAVRPTMVPYPHQFPVSAPTLLRQGLPHTPEGQAFVSNFRSLVEQSEDVLRKLGERGQESAQFRALLKESEEVLAELESKAKPVKSKGKIEHTGDHSQSKSKHHSICSNEDSHHDHEHGSRARSHSQKHSSNNNNNHHHSHHSHHAPAAATRPLPPASALLRPVPVPTHLPYAPSPFASGYLPQAMPPPYGPPPMSMGGQMMMMPYAMTGPGFVPPTAASLTTRPGQAEALHQQMWQPPTGPDQPVVPTSSLGSAMEPTRTPGSALTPMPSGGAQVPQTSQHISAPQVDLNDPD